MKPAPFDYIRPQSVVEALQLLASLPEAKILAGGQSLMPMLNMRFVQPDHVIDITRLDLSYIRLDDDQILIGAATRQRDLEFSSVIRTHAPIFFEALQHVGHVQTRNRGTIGGSLCHLDPSAELPTLCMMMDATIVAQSAARGQRTIAMREFALAYMTPAIEPDEMVTEIKIPVWPLGHGFAFEEFSRRRGDFALASAAVMLCINSGKVERAAITIGGLATAPTRIAEAESLLVGKDLARLDFDSAARLCGNIEAGSDVQASAKYRQQLATVMAFRALGRAVERAVGKETQ
jgi:carbon-monoxide dehydrogenase medium subunit